MTQCSTAAYSQLVQANFKTVLLGAITFESIALYMWALERTHKTDRVNLR